jgi:hypothetical protein
MHLWDWLLPAALVVAVILLVRLSRRLRDTQERVTILSKRLRDLRRLIILDRLRHLEDEVSTIEGLTLKQKPDGSHRVDAGPVNLASYVATCRSFADRSLEQGEHQERVDAVLRLVLRQLIQEQPSHYDGLCRYLSRSERARWLESNK